MIEGIVLAGGYSSRFNQNKMAVEFNGKALILNTVYSMLSVCKRVIVVTGHYHEEIQEILRNVKQVEIVKNENYDQGMFTSVKRGVMCVHHNFFIIPGDYPLVKEKVYHKLLKGSKSIRVPSYNHRLGHPIYFDKDLIKPLLETDVTNLKEFRNLYDFEIVEVDDEGVLLDIDTYNDMERIQKGE